ncbi:hypothetical protein [Halobacterium zhouii]|uniref:hypothetical protein n=1 Tax=Halobacterium zhouii TaxID=2902624 RepID=UPI001E3CE474|nr:hypothetical protein [Halobacterium zhouii]
MAEHPFSDDLVGTVADERSVDRADLRAALEDVQRRFERDDGGYDYSSEHNYGWDDGQLAYLYGSEHVWQAIQDDLGLSDEMAGAARAVHERAMLESASTRDNDETVREMLEGENEPLAVADRSDGPPRFGQDV